MRNYTEQQLQANYDKFIAFVKKAFASKINFADAIKYDELVHFPLRNNYSISI